MDHQDLLDKRETVETKDYVDWMDCQDQRESRVWPVPQEELVCRAQLVLREVVVAHLDHQELQVPVVIADCPAQRDWTDLREILDPVALWV